MGRAIRFMKRQMVYVIPALMLLAALGLRLEDPQFLQVFRLKLFDLYNQIQPREYQQVPVAVLDIDDETLARGGQWPWPRSRLAEMVARLFNPGTKVVARGTQGKSKAVVAWTNDYHGVRVFSTSLGHNNFTVADPRYLDLVARGLLWAVKREDMKVAKPKNETFALNSKSKPKSANVKKNS